MKTTVLTAVALCATLVTSQAGAFNLGNRWKASNSANGGPNGRLGDPITLTWSIVPDGTGIRANNSGESSDDSNLIDFFDTQYGAGPGGNDLTRRPWFFLFEDSFNRWDEVSGVNFNYEPNDDGARVTGFFIPGSGGDTTNPGVIGTRGDFRVSGHSIDGTSNTLAYNYYPNISDMILDTDDAGLLGPRANNSRIARNTFTHEFGHGLGFNHVNASVPALMQASVGANYDGPQIDDILAVQRYYGDALEENGGNDSTPTATQIGSFGGGDSFTIGADANDARVDITDTDFVSIDDDSDTDVFEFTITDPVSLSATLTPQGPTYQEDGSAFDTSSLSDLSLEILDPTGSLAIAESDSGAVGESEFLSLDLLAPSDYFVRITGEANNIQLYQLDLAFGAVPEPSTLLLVASGGAMVLLRRGRRRSRTSA